MGWKRREVLLTALGALVAFCLTVLWAILVFAPEPVLGRVELRKYSIPGSGKNIFRKGRSPKR